MLAKECVAVGTVVFGHVQRGAAEGNEATGPAAEKGISLVESFTIC